MRAMLAVAVLALALPRPGAAQVDSGPARRAVMPGLVVGGIAGALGGALLGGIAAGVCEYDCGSTAGSVAVGALLGAGAGAGLGALVGAAIPKGAHGEPIGEATLRLGASSATTDDEARSGTGPSVEGAFGPRFGPVVVMLEGGYHGISSDRHLWRYGLAARTEFGHGAWRPYLVGGLGGYSDNWRAPNEFDGLISENQVSWFGGSLGAGVRHGFAGSALSLSAEGRVHARLQDVGPPQGEAAVEFLTLYAAGHVAW